MELTHADIAKGCAIYVEWSGSWEELRDWVLSAVDGKPDGFGVSTGILYISFDQNRPAG